MEDGAPAPAPALLEMARLFNAGAFWESHEALELEWRRTRSPFYHGLILYASAWVHHQRGNRHGVTAQLDKAAPLLHRFAPAHCGVDVARMLREGEALREGHPPPHPVIAVTVPG